MNKTIITPKHQKLKNINIQLCSKLEGSQLFIKYHYSHKNVNTSKYYLGLYQGKTLYGCASFGIAMNPHSCKNIVKNSTLSDYLELNRLWISDELQYNVESLFIGACWKWIRLNLPNVKWIQTFADGRIGVGTIYQATNFLYHGYHISRFWKHNVTGEFYHDSLLTRKTRKKYHELQKIKEHLIFCPTPVYRYTYFLDTKEKKNLLLRTFKYPKKGQVDLKSKYTKGKPYLIEGIKRVSYFKTLKQKKKQ